MDAIVENAAVATAEIVEQAMPEPMEVTPTPPTAEPATTSSEPVMTTTESETSATTAAPAAVVTLKARGAAKAKKEKGSKPASKKARTDAAATPSKYKTMAEMVLEFQTKTPDRYLSKRRNSELHLPTFTPQKTQPVEFNLSTSKKRKRDEDLQTTEDKIVADMRRYSFHALPLSKKVLNSTGRLGVPPVQKARLTQPEEFELATSTRSNKRRMSVDDAASTTSTSSEFLFQARPIPASHYTPAPVPEKEAKPIVVPTPFNLQSEKLHEEYVASFQQKLTAEEKQDHEQRLFKAQPFVHAIPFVAQKSARPLTEITASTLNIDQRSAERSRFDNLVKLKEKELEEQKKKMEEEKKEREAQEIAALRKSLVPEAQPIRKFKAATQKPKKAATVPQSPQWARRLRARTSDESNASAPAAAAATTTVAATKPAAAARRVVSLRC